jgi:photosystem II stability/assembly factor-like uncharacterized protein
MNCHEIPRPRRSAAFVFLTVFPMTCAWLTGCSGHATKPSEVSASLPVITDKADLVSPRWHKYSPFGGRAPAVKPENVTFAMRKKDSGKGEMGPAPYGYWRTIGEPVPDWDVQPGAGVGGYADRSSPFVWTFLGPQPISSEYWSYRQNAGGRVVSIAPHPTNSNICYIASASGGIWKTINGGTTWTPLTDTLSTLNHGTVILNPANPNQVYIGTGEYQSGSTGDGIFTSPDGGATWSRIATSSQVGTMSSGLAIHPTNSQILHATGNSGYHRTTNGGGTWTTVISGACSALELHPTNSNTLYVAHSGVGIKRSTNGGTSFTTLTSGLPAAGTYSRIVMDISKSNPLILYAAFLSGSNSVGLYKTVNGGDTWTQITDAPNFCYPQCTYDAYVAVNPTNPDTVYLGGVDPRYAIAGVTRTTNGGTTWQEVSTTGVGLHPDHHALVWGAGNTVWAGNDGGIYRSTDGSTWVNVNSTLAASQMYHVTVHPTSSNRVLAGTQDNGTPEKTSASGIWPQLQAGDGGYSAFDPSVSTRRYTTYVYLTLYRWSNSTSSDISGDWGSDRTNWISPFVLDPNSNATMFAGTDKVYRSLNVTSSPPTWTAISTSQVSNDDTVNFLAVAKGNSNVLYVGGDNGGVWTTQNARVTTPTWTNRSVGLPTSRVTTIVIDPRTSAGAATAFVSVFRSTGERLFRTDNYGATWRAVSGSLPSGVVPRALAVDYAFDPPVMYVGAGSGMYVSFDEGASWTKNDNTFPNVNVTFLDIHAATRTLNVATYGRGVWRTPLASPPVCAADYNDDGGVDGADVESFFLDWAASEPNADINDDGGVDGADVESFYILWMAGC